MHALGLPAPQRPAVCRREGGAQASRQIAPCRRLLQKVTRWRTHIERARVVREQLRQIALRDLMRLLDADAALDQIGHFAQQVQFRCTTFLFAYRGGDFGVCIAERDLRALAVGVIDSNRDKARHVASRIAPGCKRQRNVQQGAVFCQSRGLMPGDDDWEDTAAVIANLDFIVTVDTGVMHLAGAMGKPLWVLLSGAVDPKWG